MQVFGGPGVSTLCPSYIIEVGLVQLVRDETTDNRQTTATVTKHGNHTTKIEFGCGEKKQLKSHRFLICCVYRIYSSNNAATTLKTTLVWGKIAALRGQQLDSLFWE